MREWSEVSRSLEGDPDCVGSPSDPAAFGNSVILSRITQDRDVL